MNYRRFATLKIAAHRAAGEDGLAAVWIAKRAEYPATAFPDEIPTEALAAAGYVGTEDVQGANANELLSVGVPYSVVAAVLAL